jgi:hypothetical protein
LTPFGMTHSCAYFTVLPTFGTSGTRA